LFSLEAAIKIGCTSLKEHFLGYDWSWNLFDFTIILVAVASVIFQEFTDDTTSRQLTIIRILRLTRLVRLVRIFRLRRMKELKLMVKGLFSGLSTLIWAMLLLLVFDYILSLFMVTILAVTPRRSDEFESSVRPLFRSLEMSMMTIYRCVTGDCGTSSGSPLLLLLLDEYGAVFVIPWVLCMMVITFGLFNLISAIYIENTLAAAKHQDESRKKEGLWVAQTTKRLLTKFCAAQQTINRGVELTNRKDFHSVLTESSLRDLQDTTIQISKETFLHVIQDPEVLGLMDDLDIPVERARLFDVFDADGSGTLGIRELVQGLLKVRGEAQRSDVLAGVLAVRAVFDVVRNVESEVQSLRNVFDAKLSTLSETLASRRRSPDSV